MNVWLCVCVCVAHVAAAQSGWLNALKLRWRCLKFVPDLIQGNSTEARDLSRDVQKQLFWISFPLSGDFLHTSVSHSSQVQNNQPVCTASWCEEHLFPQTVLRILSTILCVCVLQTASMHLDTEAFKTSKIILKKDNTLLVFLMKTEQWECVIYIVGG